MNTTSTRQKVGLVLAGVLSLTSIPSVLMGPPDGEVGPPVGILVLGTVLGVVGLVAVVIAWVRHSGAAVRIAAGCLIINLLSGLPAFFVDVPVWIKLMTGVSALVTIVVVVLMFSGARRPVTGAEVRAS